MLAERVKEWTHEWKQEGWELGRQEGMQKGMQKGRQEGGTELLLRQLKLKFGELDKTTIEQVQQANESQLLKWSERILTCDSLDDFFQD